MVGETIQLHNIILSDNSSLSTTQSFVVKDVIAALRARIPRRSLRLLACQVDTAPKEAWWLTLEAGDEDLGGAVGAARRTDRLDVRFVGGPGDPGDELAGRVGPSPENRG